MNVMRDISISVRACSRTHVMQRVFDLLQKSTCSSSRIAYSNFSVKRKQINFSERSLFCLPALYIGLVVD